MTQNSVIDHLHQHDKGSSVLRLAGVVIVVAVLCGFLQGCAGESDQKPVHGAHSVPGDSSRKVDDDPHLVLKDMPAWLDLYRKRVLVKTSTIDHVVIITFESLAERDEVFDHYASEFEGEDNFSSFRDGRDIISFVRDGYGVKITLLDVSKNRWSVEYHHQSI